MIQKELDVVESLTTIKNNLDNCSIVLESIITRLDQNLNTEQLKKYVLRYIKQIDKYGIKLTPTELFEFFYYVPNVELVYHELMKSGEIFEVENRIYLVK